MAYGVSRCDAAGPRSAAPTESSLEAAAAARRLDDTFRSYLAERGAKPIPLAEVTSLVTGVAGVRLAGDAVLDLWDGGEARGGDRAAARRALLGAAEHLSGWYDHFAGSLTGDPGTRRFPLRWRPIRSPTAGSSTRSPTICATPTAMPPPRESG